MACVILPSETARLVYGYLVKENLNDIALQFLESSPYLMDCCQIVKSGFQFNTKLMGKDLPELLQEYSVIHNLVNSKISNLCKTSLLYKRIKLRCESLPEILELILFWKYKNPKSEEISSSNDKYSKSSAYTNSNYEYSKSKNISQIKINENASDITCFNKNEKSNSVQKENPAPESQHSKLNCEMYSDDVFMNSDIADDESNIQKSKNILQNVEDGKNSKESSLFVSIQSNEVPVSLEKNDVDSDNSRNINSDTATLITAKATTVCMSNSTSGNNNLNNSSSNSESNSSNNINNNNNNNNNNFNDDNNCNEDNANNSCLPDSKFSNTANIPIIDVDSHCEELVNNAIQTDALVSNEEPSRFENPIKIVEIQEESESDNQSLGVFPKPLEEGEGNMNLTNSSVVFVSPDVGNVTINQEQSQIIVIPFDYYKTQNGLQNEIDIDSNKDLGLISNEVINQKNNPVFEDGTRNANSSSINLLFNNQNKNNAVDGNIITESDFLKNRHLMYNLEKEIYKREAPHQQQLSQDLKENISVQTVSAPVIVVSQPLHAEPSRYRAILPKKKKPVPVHPVVVVHPLLENNKDLMKSNSNTVRSFPAAKLKREVSRRVKKRNIVSQKAKNKEAEKSEIFQNQSKRTLDDKEKALGEVMPNKSEVEISSDKQAEVERTNEEKENLEKTENKKNETPVFFTKRNSKRLSLSTPRRRSHIRALEFETPPKTNEEKKKSKTSPKVKVEQVKVERKSVRNTLFKSPIPENTFKSPVLTKEKKKLPLQSQEPFKTPDQVEPLNELSIPIATRSPNTKLSDAWENLTGVGCVIGQSDLPKTSPTKKIWDADLRCFILENSLESVSPEKKRMRKPEKTQKDNRKSTKKKLVPPKRIKPISVTVSPSKISLTAKRNTYSINGNEEGSPVRTLIDDLKIVTPFKDIETIRPAEETPLTKLLRENINTIDIDLSMINTPSFPPTPSIVITPDLDDACMTGTNYYSPMKDGSKDRLLKISDYFKADSDKSNKKDTKEMHEKVIGDLVSKAKEIIGLGKEAQEENSLKRRPSGKILSMVKIQMLTQCDKKLMENIPIYEETTFSNTFSNQTVIGNVIEKTTPKTDLKVELEEKRKRALRKIKVVKENLSQIKNRVTKRGRKRKRSENLSKSDKSKSDVSKDSLEDEQEILQPNERVETQYGIIHSTPLVKKDFDKFKKTDSEKKVNDKILEDIRQQFPPFQNDSEKYPELSEKSRKKFHYVENFSKLPVIVKFIDEFNVNSPPKLFLKPSLRRFFHVFYKWLRHPHKKELNASPETNALLKEYLSLFDKVNLGLSPKCKIFKRDKSTPNVSEFSSIDSPNNNTGSKVLQLDEHERGPKRKGSEKRKDEDVEDGVVSTLPLKKRKSTVQQVENETISPVEKNDTKSNNCENVSQTQNFLQDIDVDRFLSQIHGQETRQTYPSLKQHCRQLQSLHSWHLMLLEGIPTQAIDMFLSKIHYPKLLSIIQK